MSIKKGDLAIIVILIAAILVWFSKDIFLADNGDIKAIIKIDGEVHSTLVLDKSDARKEIPLNLPDDNFMRIITEKGQVWIEESTCPDKICEKTGVISKRGQSIVCLPNKTVVFIEGMDDEMIDDVSN